MNELNYKNAGITRKELESWWNRHEKLDEKHRQMEILREEKMRKAKEKKAKIEAAKKKYEEALNTLSAEDKVLLGIESDQKSLAAAVTRKLRLKTVRL